jgi:hypothetical protein
VSDAAWPAVSYGEWSATCDTLHGHSQVLGKIAAELGFPEPQLQHAALRLTARGWETTPLPAPDGSGAIVAALDLHQHAAVVEHSDGRRSVVALQHDRSVGEVTREVLAAASDLAGRVEIDPTPQEVHWTVPLDEDSDHATYDPDAVGRFHAAATAVALALAEFRAPYRGRATPVNAWWGSFDVAVNLYSGLPAEPPSEDFIERNSMDVQEFALGWWPGDPSYPRAAFYAYAHPAPPDFAGGPIDPEPARWEEEKGLYLLDWEDARAAPDPHGAALEFARSAFRHTCSVCDWDPRLAASAEGSPPPVS